MSNKPVAGATLVVAGAIIVVFWMGAPTGRAPEEVRFAPVQPELFGAPGSLTDAWADVDGDGDPDRFVGFNGEPSRLYRNDGRDGFVDVAPEVGLAVARSVRTAAWGDYDGDGDPDLLLGYAGDAPVTALFRNDRADGFTEVSAQVGLRLDAGVTRQASWVDFDADGDLDLFLAMRDGPNRLYRNTGGSFRDVADSLGLADSRRSVGAVWLDLNADGLLDVVVGNMNGDANGAWIQGPDGFTDVAGGTGLAGGGRPLGDESLGTVRPCAVDVDGDGALDVSTANYGPNGLLRGGGDGSWPNVAGDLGLANDARYDTCAWADYDHDGRVDVYVNGTITGGVQYRDWLLRRGSGDVFLDATPVEIATLAADHGATWVDYDLDGDLDLALTGVADDGMHHLMQNLLRPEFAWHSLQVRVMDERGRAVYPGASVRVYAAGTDRILGTRIVDSGSGYDAQSDLPVHFGLPGGQPVDVEVTLPLGPERAGAAPPRARVPDVDPQAHRGGYLEVRVDRTGRVVG